MSSRGGYGRRKRDEDEGPILVYGRNPVRELIKAGRREVSEVWVLTQAADDPALEGVAIAVKTREELARVAGTGDHQGMVAFTEEYPYADPQDILEGTGPVIVLDEVQDPRDEAAVELNVKVTDVTRWVFGRAHRFHVRCGDVNNHRRRRVRAGNVERPIPVEVRPVVAAPRPVREARKSKITRAQRDADSRIDGSLKVSQLHATLDVCDGDGDFVLVDVDVGECDRREVRLDDGLKDVLEVGDAVLREGHLEGRGERLRGGSARPKKKCDHNQNSEQHFLFS